MVLLNTLRGGHLDLDLEHLHDFSDEKDEWPQVQKYIYRLINLLIGELFQIKHCLKEGNQVLHWLIIIESLQLPAQTK